MDIEKQYKSGKYMTDEQRVVFDELICLKKFDQADLYLDKCEKANRTKEYQDFLDRGLFTGMGASGRFMD